MLIADAIPTHGYIQLESQCCWQLHTALRAELQKEMADQLM